MVRDSRLETTDIQLIICIYSVVRFVLHNHIKQCGKHVYVGNTAPLFDKRCVLGIQLAVSGRTIVFTSYLAPHHQVYTMSRLTSAQVISLGEYLGPDFDPNSLTVSQLLGVLGYHNVKYPTPYTKNKLIQVFNAEIKSRASKFKKERLKKESSIASDDGITDGLTGEPLNKGKVRRFQALMFATLTSIQGQGARACSQAIFAASLSSPIHCGDLTSAS